MRRTPERRVDIGIGDIGWREAPRSRSDGPKRGGAAATHVVLDLTTRLVGVQGTALGGLGTRGRP